MVPNQFVYKSNGPITREQTILGHCITLRNPTMMLLRYCPFVNWRLRYKAACHCSLHERDPHYTHHLSTLEDSLILTQPMHRELCKIWTYIVATHWLTSVAGTYGADRPPVGCTLGPQRQARFPLEIFLDIATFLPPSTLTTYMLVCKAFSGSLRRLLYMDVTLSTFRGYKAFENVLSTDPTLCKDIRILRISAGSAAICLSDFRRFSQLQELTYLKDWKDDLWDSPFKPKRFFHSTSGLTLTKITIQAEIELNQLIHIITLVNTLVTLSCGSLGRNNNSSHLKVTQPRCSLRALCIGGDMDFTVS